MGGSGNSSVAYAGNRLLDVLFAGSSLLLLLIPMAIIAVCVISTSSGPALYWSDRVGAGNRLFRMPKFRTMRTDAPALATHLMTDPDAYVTEVGKFLRKTSLDELPQLWSILQGDMSVVGPRPALFNQDDLIECRSMSGAHNVKPGLTGWAQVNGRDELSIAEKVKFDVEYVQRKSLVFDLKIIFLTFVRVFEGAGVSH